MDVAAEIRNDRMFVPLRFIAETFGADVTWDQQTQTITIINRDNPDSNPRTDLSQAATYLPAPGMQLHYFRNYADGTKGNETVYTRQPVAGSGYLLDVCVISDESGDVPDYRHHYIANDDGIYECYSTDAVEGPLLPWLKNNLQKGSTWKYSGDNGSIIWEVQSVDQTVTVGSHTFEYCLVVKKDNQEVGWVFLCYYAPGLGMVREESPPGGELTAQLESWN